ncbi:RNA methyltransferase [Suhomyces tanzawaensis NRRL Y-17324]|uniref:rRNA methyltransferase 1, mitochondrial n=1 Tax=Suhomyces tanzawaensis NRRL Y-17324 TaxID=984487 RepID=A0A1E4SMA2_9ASCO|nr:RNA methyltransferase [Suhomyces tanzawaensis NRRL Y-17324]ODV80512.1 RNA methyltransferase [Suhomyces tanzawaensis NRRL Y-17324]
MSKNIARKVASTVKAVKPVFKPHHSGTQAVKSFDKSMPKTEKVGRPWEAMNMSKDEFFGRKYGNISENERNRLNEKVERQRRARASRMENERAERQAERESRRESRPRTSSRSSGTTTSLRNPLFEYMFGTHAVKAALKAGKRPSYNKLYVHNCNDKELIKMAQTMYGLKVVERANKNELNILCNNGVHNGVVLETKNLELPTIHELGVCQDGHYEVSVYDEMYDKQVVEVKPIARKAPFPIGVYLDGITDPQNMGGIIRSAYYFGVDFIVIPESNSARLGPVASKAAVGAMDMMDIYEASDSLKFIERIRANGWNVISTGARPAHDELQELKTKHDKVETHLKNRFVELEELAQILSQGPVLLVMGSEGEGVRTNMKLRSDYLVGIDKGRGEDDVDSLNVSVAAGILMSVATRG